jgi:hypothetical protein
VAGALLFCIGIILVESKESRRSSCTLHKKLYLASGAPSGIAHVLIVGRLDMDGQSFATIGLHKTDAASDWLPIKWHCIGTKGLPGVQLQN